MLKVLRQQTTSPSPQDAERLRAALVLALESHAAARRGTAAERLRGISQRLSRFPIPTGLERQLEQVLSEPPRPARTQRPHAQGTLRAAAAETARALLALAEQAALPEPELEEGVSQLRALVPTRLGLKEATQLTDAACALLKEVAPIRRRFLDTRAACLELVEALVEQIEQGTSANTRVADRAGTLVTALSGAGPEDVRALRAELVSGLSAIRQDAEQVRAALADCEQRITSLERQLDASDTALRRAREEASLDPLTQVLNRRGFEPLLDAAIAAARRSGRPLCLAMVDLDHFKSLNDTYGHPTGDMVLQVAARTLEENLRGSDAVGRVGGEEFAVLMPDTDLAAAEQLVERLRVALSRKYFVSGHQRFSVTASLGLAELRPGEARPALIDRADQALYRAKGAGRDCWRSD